MWHVFEVYVATKQVFCHTVSHLFDRLCNHDAYIMSHNVQQQAEPFSFITGKNRTTRNITVTKSQLI